jgi:hypothetical protein
LNALRVGAIGLSPIVIPMRRAVVAAPGDVLRERQVPGSDPQQVYPLGWVA